MTFKGVPNLSLYMKQSPVYHEIAPYLRLPVDFLHTNQCNVDKHFHVSDFRHFGFAMKIGLECGFILKDDISQFYTISNSLGPF